MTKNFIDIKNDSLVFNFGELGDNEKLAVNFNRTLRIPDDNKKYSLPPGLGRFPLAHVEDYTNNLPSSWAEHGGIFFPMYQAEAMWMAFTSYSGRPFAVKIASGKVNAVSGKKWTNELQGNVKISADNPIQTRNTLVKKEEPDYLVAPKQPWLDGFNVGEGVIRQFVAVPLESGYTVEQQVTGKAEHGGIQIMVYPMKDEAWNKIKEQENTYSRGLLGGFSGSLASCEPIFACATACASSEFKSKGITRGASAKPDMGLGAGGMMTQEIFEDEYGLDVWDQTQGLRVFIHLANSEQYKMITGKNPPTEPPTPSIYNQYGYPWFEYYSDGPVLKGSEALSKVDSIGSMQTKNNEQVLPDDGHKPSPNQKPIKLGSKTKTVSSGNW